ncbi:MAG: HlyD family efflux transporter periplasmic adaptor subunit, partial [Bacteroidales bacterium]|nr:HlyD family efflux transporter periplasmic adaptor subunit [Bacteroidales bacterium]
DEDQAKENNLSKEKDKLNQMTIITDTEGPLLYSTSWDGVKIKEGDVVWDLRPIASVPDITGMIVNLKVNETHYKQIEINQKLEITIDAQPDIFLTGKIKSKSQVGKPVKRDSKVKMYEISATLDSSQFVTTPNLSTTCRIYVQELPDTLTIPIISVFEYDSSKIVYLAYGNKFKRQVIETGSHSNTQVIISKGLSEGEFIALNEPSLSMIIDTGNRKRN